MYTFKTGADGYGPRAGVILDPQGNLYGTTPFGGANGGGTVYKLDPSGRKAILHNFSGGADGGTINGGVIQDAAGTLYGTAAGGGAIGPGLIFKLDPSGGETVLHSFAGSPTDGNEPDYSLTVDSFGNLYGSTTYGGASGVGSVFKNVYA